MKVLFLVLDGLADISHPELGGMTPLQAASTPILDRLAEEGCCALMYTLEPGVCPSSEVAHWRMFGFSPEEYPGRAYFHALSEGVPCQEGDALFMFNLVPVTRRGGDVYVVDENVSATAEFCALCAVDLEAAAPPGMELHYVGGIEFLAVVEKGSPHVLPSDPFLHHLPVGEIAPQPGWEEDEDTVRTVRLLREFKDKAERAAAGKAGLGGHQAGLIMKWPSRAMSPLSFRDRYGMVAAAVVSTPCFRGMGSFLGMRVVAMGKKEAGADLGAKLGAVREWFREGGDFAFVHTKHADEAAHAGDPRGKAEVIEAMDRALGEHAELAFSPEVLTLVTCDHSTPTTRDPRVIHGGDPVPVLFHAPTVRKDAVRRFDEVSAAGGGMGQLRGEDLMPLVLYFSRRAPYGVRS